MDFLKHISEIPIKMPNIKAHRIFNMKNRTVADGQQIPPSTIIDRSPSQISRISSLVEGAPKYDFGLENVTYSNYRNKSGSNIELNNKNDSDKKNLKLTDKLTKQYKEFSEFKFKTILTRKTIVRKTEINIETYKNRYDEERQEQSSEHSDYEFEFQSLPAPRISNPETDELFNKPYIPVDQRKCFSTEFEDISKITTIPNDIPTSITIEKKSESLQGINKIEPNDSSLWRRRAIKRKSLQQNPTISSSRKQSTTSDKRKLSKSKNGNIEIKWTEHKQAFDSACDKARKKMNSKWEKFKLLHATASEFNLRKSKSSPIEISSEFDSNKDVPKKGIPSRNIFKDSFETLNTRDELEDIACSSKTFKSHSKYNWIPQKITKSSFDDENPTISNCLKHENIAKPTNIETIVILNRPAPPIPKREFPSIKNSETVTNTRIISTVHKITSPPLEKKIQPNIIVDITKCHTRKPSIDSNDSDSWIPENFQNSTLTSRNQTMVTGLNKIDENNEPWNHYYGKSSFMNSDNFKILRKAKSVDIFTNEGEETAFEDFDDILKNVPVIQISRNEKNIHKTEIPIPKPSSKLQSMTMSTFQKNIDIRKPIVKQSSITKQYSNEIPAGDLNVNVNKLISHFQENHHENNITEMNKENLMENLTKLNSNLEILKINNIPESKVTPPTPILISSNLQRTRKTIVDINSNENEFKYIEKDPALRNKDNIVENSTIKSVIQKSSTDDIIEISSLMKKDFSNNFIKSNQIEVRRKTMKMKAGEDKGKCKLSKIKYEQKNRTQLISKTLQTNPENSLCLRINNENFNSEENNNRISSNKMTNMIRRRYDDEDINRNDIMIADRRIISKDWAEVGCKPKEKLRQMDSDDDIFYSFDKDESEILEDTRRESFRQKIVRQIYCIEL